MASDRDNQGGRRPGSDAATTAVGDTTNKSALDDDFGGNTPDATPSGSTDVAAASRSARTSGSVVDAFRKATGLKEADILASNDERQTVVTAAGGKYRLEDGRFLVVSGPVIEGTESPVAEPNPLILPGRGA
jgi:hypothetical protein